MKKPNPRPRGRPKRSGPTTLEQRLAEAKALVARLEAELAAESVADRLDVGHYITYLFGRGETKRQEEGRVVGMARTGQGTIVAVEVAGSHGLPDIKHINVKTVLQIVEKPPSQEKK